MEGFLEEMLLLCQRSEEYNQFMLAKMHEAVAPKTLNASRENTFRWAYAHVPCTHSAGVMAWRPRRSVWKCMEHTTQIFLYEWPASISSACHQ